MGWRGVLAGGYAGIMVAGGAVQSQAADITKRILGPGRVDLIVVSGRLEVGDERKFIDLALRSRSAVVAFSSNGGSLNAGIEIGKAIRMKGFGTAVADGASCASACALAWLGGRTRWMGPHAQIGFHAAYIANGEQKQVNGAANALVGAYVDQLGLSSSAVVFVTSAAPDQIRWLSADDARTQGIAVELADGGLPTCREEDPVGPSPPAAPPVFAPPAVLRRAPAALSPAALPPTALPPTAPTPTAIASHPDDAEARVTQADAVFFATAGAEKPVVAAYLMTIYDETVQFYGKMRSRADVMKDKLSYLERWPNRVYRVEPSSLIAACAGPNDCTMTGIVDWDLTSAARGIHATGAARFQHSWTRGAQGWKLVAESSRVVARKSATVAREPALRNAGAGDQEP